MSYRSKQNTFVFLLVLCALGLAGVAWWSAERSYDNLSAVRLANEVLARHINLAASANDLFKQHADALLIGDRDRGEREDFLREEIRKELYHIRSAIAEEILYQGQEEADELERLAQIERELAGIETEFARVKRLRAEQGEDAALSALVRLLDQRMDERLRGLIDAAVEEERSEVAETSANAKELLRRSNLLTEIALGFTVVVAIAAVVVLRRSLNRPIEALLRGTQALREGDLGHRIGLDTRDEFGALAKSFDAMTEELQSARASLDDSRRSLEDEVQERTADLKAANDRLAEQDRMRRRFLADISHELRTPLTVIRGEAEIALRGRSSDLSPVAEETLRATVENAEQMTRLVDDLLFVARREAGEARLALRPVDLVSLVRSVVSDAQALAAPSGVSVVLEQAEERAIVEGDIGRLRQLFLVLLDNAVRYSPKNGLVSVCVMRGPGSVTVRIVDLGIGIPVDDLPNVFDRFVRGSNAMPGGSGLGLPVARAIATAHDGNLTIESEEGRGTTASVMLPLADGPRAVA